MLPKVPWKQCGSSDVTYLFLLRSRWDSQLALAPAEGIQVVAPNRVAAVPPGQSEKTTVSPIPAGGLGAPSQRWRLGKPHLTGL